MIHQALAFAGRLLPPVAMVAGGFLLGLLGQGLLRGRLRRMAKRTGWQGIEVSAASLRGLIVLWLTLAGIYGALIAIHPAPELDAIVRRVLLVIFLVSATIALSRFSAGLVKLYADRQESLVGSTSIFVNIAKTLSFILGALVILQSLGISITPLLTALGVGGLAVALALQDTLSNFFAGIHIIASRLIRPGDFLRVENEIEGIVTDITWRNTTIRTLQNSRIIIPNVKLASAIITNHHLPDRECVFDIPFTVSYGSDPREVERVALETAESVMRETPGAAPSFTPIFRFAGMGQSGLECRIVLRAREYTDQFLLRHELIKRLYRALQEADLEIPFPARTVYLKQSVEFNKEG